MSNAKKFGEKATNNQISTGENSLPNSSKIPQMKEKTGKLWRTLYKSWESEVRNDSSKCATEGARLLVVKREAHLPTIWDTGEP